MYVSDRINERGSPHLTVLEFHPCPCSPPRPAPPSIATQLVGSGLIGLREGLEAGIVVMILVAFLVKAERRDALKWVWLGVGIAVAMVAATFLVIHFGTSTLDGLAAEIAAGGIASLVAVVIVTAMVLWMRKAARSISGDLRSGGWRRPDRRPDRGPVPGVLRGGPRRLETALLMVGYAENAAGSAWPLIGLLLGIVTAAVLTVLMYLGAVRIDMAKFFKFTGGVFLVVVAAGILAYGVRALQIGGLLPGAGNLAFDATAHYDAGSWYGTILGGILNVRPRPDGAPVRRMAGVPGDRPVPVPSPPPQPRAGPGGRRARHRLSSRSAHTFSAPSLFSERHRPDASHHLCPGGSRVLPPRTRGLHREVDVRRRRRRGHRHRLGV